jgi:hypothetical protein
MNPTISSFFGMGAIVLVACSGGSTTINGTSSGSSGSPSGSSSGSTDPTPSRPAWSYGNTSDESAYCDLYSKAESITDASSCEQDSVLQTSRLSSCTKLTPCYRVLYEADFLERQRTCLEGKLACSRDLLKSCEEEAGTTYAGTESYRAACASKKAACKQTSQKLDLGCDQIGGFTEEARTKTTACFAASKPCADVIDCITLAGGSACNL